MTLKELEAAITKARTLGATDETVVGISTSSETTTEVYASLGDILWLSNYRAECYPEVDL